ncbi:hypothetical protein BDZ45DRAFT_684604 [Acephala macrosclerotiorum]|nr:hypothetical protein BDZ45DRAFT_684604 [Acephala macrosclerotiorum]
MSSQIEVEESPETRHYSAFAQNHPSIAIPPQNQMEREKIPDLFLPLLMYEPDAEELQYEVLLETYPPPTTNTDTTFVDNNQNLSPNDDDKVIITIGVDSDQLRTMLIITLTTVTVLVLSLFIRAYGLPITRFLWNHAPAVKDSIQWYLENSSFWVQHQSAFWWMMSRMGALLVVKFVLDLTFSRRKMYRHFFFASNGDVEFIKVRACAQNNLELVGNEGKREDTERAESGNHKSVEAQEAGSESKSRRDAEKQRVRDASERDDGQDEDNEITSAVV